MWPSMAASQPLCARCRTGIQQPAVSGQIARLEEALGAKLFNRRPFSLLPAGAELFEFIKPFFDDMDKVAGRIRGASLQLRIAAPSVVLHDYVPELLRRVRRRFPSFPASTSRGRREPTPRDCCWQETSILRSLRWMLDVERWTFLLRSLRFAVSEASGRMPDLAGKTPTPPGTSNRSRFLVIPRYVFQDLNLSSCFAHRRAGRLVPAGCRFFEL